MIITLKELIDKKNIRSLLAVFFNTTKETVTHFIVESKYGQSKFLNSDGFKKEEINNGLSLYFDLSFTTNRFGNHVIKIKKNDEIITIDLFLKEIYKQIQILSFDIETLEYQEAIIMSLFSLRGSPDLNRKYFAVDIYRKYSTKEYLRYIFQLLSSTSAISQLNFNFREFQPQFINKKNKRNNQIRINLGWFWEKYNLKLEKINYYKYSIIFKNTQRLTYTDDKQGNFASRLIEYLNNVLGEENINREDIKEQRIKLKLDQENIVGRNYTIKNIANNIFPDECICCKDIHKKDYRTFKLRDQNKHYFELHHVIPFSAGKEHDQIDNLAKLCPVCHRILTKSRAEEELQKQTIMSILNNSKNATEYVSILVGNSDINELVNYVYERLA